MNDNNSMNQWLQTYGIRRYTQYHRKIFTEQKTSRLKSETFIIRQSTNQFFMLVKNSNENNFIVI